MRYRHHKYTYTNPFGSPNHQWSMIGPDGGMHFHVSVHKDYPPSCGLEIHYATKRGNEAPSQVPCWLIGAPCWHDGTSLYASEYLWPRIEAYLRAGDHDRIFSILEREADDRFGYRKDADEAESPAIRESGT